MIDILIKIGSLVVDIFKNYREDDEEKKERVAELLDKISNLLEDLHVDLMVGEYPHGKCAEMELLAAHLKDVLKDHLEEEYLEMLVKNLNSAIEIEKLYAYRDDPEILNDIKRASGYFRAASILACV
jgi:hypothetical protein